MPVEWISLRILYTFSEYESTNELPSVSDGLQLGVKNPSSDAGRSEDE